MFENIAYYLILGWLYLHAILPLRVLYVLSDILYLLIYYVVRYRLKVVRKNIENSFPEKSKKELRKIERQFYRHFSDYIVETIKLLSISDEEMSKRFVFENPEVVNEYLKTNSILLYLGHYGNWEWITSITLVLDPNNPDLIASQIYRPLNNKVFDKIFLKIRSRFGSTGIAKNDTFKGIVRFRNQGKQQIVGFISDQSPRQINIHYWTTFMDQETPVFTGVERIAKQTGFGVYYLDVQKVGRGRYRGTFRLISEDPKNEPEFALTEQYVRMLETTVMRNPAYWLWTHNRWKHKKTFRNK